MADDKGKQKSLAKIETEYTRRHNRHLDKYQRQIAAVYKAAAQDAARIGIRFDAPTDRIFSFKDYPGANRQIKSLLKRMSRDIRAIVQGGIDAEWQLANDKLDDTVALALGFNLTGEQMRRYYNSNSEALAAFRQRKASGMSLSERVWNLTEQFKSELELALDGGIRDGLSADEMSRQIRQYLNNPDKLFRRVRDEHGILQLSRRAAAFHPGQGMYRSSYKNARRLAGTETNIAYRLADHLRLQQLDFVVGIKVVLSNNHTTTNSKGETVELHDICDELAGNYPKTFVFTGWHPNCRCHTETILLTAEERKGLRAAGLSAIIYLAAITGISSDLYEAAEMDGATRLQQIFHVTIPSIMPTIMVMLIMNVGRMLSIGYEKVLLMYTPSNSGVSDIIDTLVYRTGLQNQNYSYATAIGLFGGIIGLILVSGSNAISKKLTDESLY